jgi:hypothetical protein
MGTFPQNLDLLEERLRRTGLYTRIEIAEAIRREIDIQEAQARLHAQLVAGEQPA